MGIPQPFHGLLNVLWVILPLIFLGLSIAVICLTKDKKMRMKRVVFPIIAVAMFVVAQYSALWSAFQPFYKEDIIIDIPDSDVKLIAKESTTLWSSTSYIYIKKDVGKKLVACVDGREDGYLYFKEGTYEVINNGDNTVTVILRDPITKQEYIETFEIE